MYVTHLQFIYLIPELHIHPHFATWSLHYMYSTFTLCNIAFTLLLEPRDTFYAAKYHSFRIPPKVRVRVRQGRVLLPEQHQRVLHGTHGR